VGAETEGLAEFEGFANLGVLGIDVGEAVAEGFVSGLEAELDALEAGGAEGLKTGVEQVFADGSNGEGEADLAGPESGEGFGPFDVPWKDIVLEEDATELVAVGEIEGLEKG
jgi:hypothetical protein